MTVFLCEMDNITTKPNQDKDKSLRSSNWCLIATLHNYPFNQQKSTSNLTKELLNRNISTARKIHNCKLFVPCASDKKEYQISVCRVSKTFSTFFTTKKSCSPSKNYSPQMMPKHSVPAAPSVQTTDNEIKCFV